MTLYVLSWNVTFTPRENTLSHNRLTCVLRFGITTLHYTRDANVFRLVLFRTFNPFTRTPTCTTAYLLGTLLPRSFYAYLIVPYLQPLTTIHRREHPGLPRFCHPAPPYHLPVWDVTGTPCRPPFIVGGAPAAACCDTASPLPVTQHRTSYRVRAVRHSPYWFTGGSGRAVFWRDYCITVTVLPLLRYSGIMPAPPIRGSVHPDAGYAPLPFSGRTNSACVLLHGR